MLRESYMWAKCRDLVLQQVVHIVTNVLYIYCCEDIYIRFVFIAINNYFRSLKQESLREATRPT